MGLLKNYQNQLNKNMNMDNREIQNLIKFVSRSGVNEVSIEQGDFKITIKTDSPIQEQQFYAQTQQAAPVQQIPVAQVQQPVAQTTVAAPVDQAPKSENNANYVTIKSPMIGTFYRKPSPDKDVFVNVGDTVSVGDVICVVEAMKLFNEIESEVAGKIVKVLVDDISPIEYDQPLFLVDPS
jgi:acetyl-CoA carboxylase biotin carboxyl carrier protein